MFLCLWRRDEDSIAKSTTLGDGEFFLQVLFVLQHVYPT